MEQLVARRAHNPEAVGSNPAPATMNNENPLKFQRFRGFFLALCSMGKCAILLDFMGDFCAKSVKKVLNIEPEL